MRMYKRSATLNPTLSGSLTNKTIEPVSTGAFGKGYIAGGNGPSSIIDLLNFTNETSIAPGIALSIAKQEAVGINSNLFGYFCGGSDGSVNKKIDGVNFGTDTILNQNAVLTTARSGSSGCNSSSKGYISGGYATTFSNAIDTFNYSTLLVSLLSATLTLGRQNGVGISSNIRGYSVGGQPTMGTSNITNVIDGVVFATDTVIPNALFINVARCNNAGTNSATKGYVYGGIISGGNYTKSIEAINFSSETNNTVSAMLNEATAYVCGVNSTNNGYFCGGYDSALISAIKGLNFTTETSYLPGSTLSLARYRATGVSYIASAPVIGSGYMCGGVGATQYTNTEKFIFSNETNSVISSVMSVSHYYGSGVSSNISGYVATGSSSLNTDKLNFATNIFTLIAAKISKNKSNSGAIQSSVKGYFSTAVVSDLVDSITFNTDTYSTLSSIISSGPDGPETLNSAIKGYIAGGYRPGGYSAKLDGFIFSSETNAVITNSLDIGRGYGGGVSNSNTGYLFNGNVASGGSGYSSTSISKMIFNTEVCSNVSATLNKLRNYCSGYISTAKAYMSAGFDNGVFISTIESLSLATEATVVLSAKLTSGRYGAASLQSSS